MTSLLTSVKSADPEQKVPLCDTMWLRRNCCYWTYPVTFILYLMWKDIICQKFDSYRIKVKRNITVQEGLCVLIPCNFTVNKKVPWSDNIKGFWLPELNYEDNKTIAYLAALNSTGVDICDPDSMLVERRSFNTAGVKLRARDCSLIINDASKADSGFYLFRIEDGHLKYSYRSTMLMLQVTDLRETPSISSLGNLIAGKQVTLACTAPGKCSGTAPIITWEGSVREDNTVSVPGLKWVNKAMKDNLTGTWTYSSKATFTPSLKDHQSSITCRVTFPAVPTSTQKTIILGVQYELSILITIEIPGDLPLTGKKLFKPVTVKEGDSLNLSCSMDSSPQSNISWMKGNEIFASSVSGKRLLLLLRNITPSEADTYRCSAWNAYAEINRAVNIIVEYSPRRAEIHMTRYKDKAQPFYPKDSKPVVVKEGYDLTMRCSVDSNPRAKMTWMIGKKRFISSMSGQYLELKLLRITPSEAGTYMCSAWNAHGHTSKAVNISVLYSPKKPEIDIYTYTHTGVFLKKQSTPVTVREGDMLIMSCSADSNPEANLTWMKGEESFVSSVSGQRLELQLWNITPSEADTYRCSAWNKHGNISRAVKINVEYSPRTPEIDITSYTENEAERIGKDTFRTVFQGSSVSLLCSCDSFPPAKLQWMRGSETLTNTQLVGNKLKLHVKNGSVNNEEDYVCRAQNQYGTSNNSITIVMANRLALLEVRNAMRDMMIGGLCGMSIIIFIFLIEKFITKIRKVYNHPSTEESAEDINQSCSSANKATPKNPTDPAHSNGDQQNLLYTPTPSSTSQPRACTSHQETK
ncbi:sialic acid-binding Ig-like lectin 11 isoform X4 [Ascaphus truei]|uniref:sialic acid-binding Ig-like lectin 11 isoform X4 n=1 Tax=Ascaphus truei TaxID=8439 RepID=UPI003F5AA9BE